MIVIEASALTDFLLDRPQASDAVRSALAGREQQPLHAPELVEPETLNALRRLVSRGAVSEERATEAVTSFDELRLLRYPHAPLRRRVWGLRHELTAYDATYLALAEVLPDALLITADGGLASRARSALGSGRVLAAG